MPHIAGVGLDDMRPYVLHVIVNDPDAAVISQGDITTFPTDAIVNAANSELVPGGGVDGAIHRAGGPDIARECAAIRREKGRLEPGQVIRTTAGQLPAKSVIHTVGPVWRGGTFGESEQLGDCYRNSCALADSLRYTTISFPAISTGVYGYPMRDAAQIAIPVLLDAIAKAKHLCVAYVVLYDRESQDVWASEAVKYAEAEGFDFTIGRW